MTEVKLSVTGELVHVRESAMTTVRHAENLMDAMGLLKKRTQEGSLHLDRVLESITLEKAGDLK